MGRLIDADALFPNGVFVVDEKNPMKSITELINRIANAPTAYDVEKVVQELNEESSMFHSMFGYSVRSIRLGKAKEIVRKGGVE